MYSKILSAVLYGLEGNAIEIETSIGNGLPYYVIVGLPNRVIKESKDRVKSAIVSSGYDFPDQKITQNMFPAHLKKEGAHLDLPIAMGILACRHGASLDLTDIGFIGELSLDGEIRPVMGALSLIEGMKKSGVATVVLPVGNREDVSGFEGLNLFFYETLKALTLDLIEGTLKTDVQKPMPKVLRQKPVVDFNQVIGQAAAIRAMEIASMNRHSVLLIGPPGCGKSMIAERLYTVLPEPSNKEILEIKRIRSFVGESNAPMARPFAMPHHTISLGGMIGGTSALLPGLVTKTHNGILYLDEIVEFKPEVLEALREPLSNKEIQLTRNYQSVKYPADFMLIATMNPCLCGNHLSKTLTCSCTAYTIKRHIKRLSGPLLDRVQMIVYMDRVDLLKGHQPVSSEEMKKRIQSGLVFKEKYVNKGRKIIFESDAEEALANYYAKGKISLRRHDALVAVAESIAFLDQSEQIKKHHLLEAISYQSIERLTDVL